MARMIGRHLTVRLGQQVVIDDKPGAGNNLGAEFVAKASADGYTLLMCNSSLAVADYLYARLGYRPMVDLLPVTQVSSAPLMLVLHPSLPARSVPELIAMSRPIPAS
jgi:tripartite-type tricarboxylate transporter receptor subunit TctC